MKKQTLQRFAIDHTLLDLMVIDPKEDGATHRLWVTTVVDPYSRMARAYVGLAPFGEAHGIPGAVFSDKGKEFCSTLIDGAGLRQGPAERKRSKGTRTNNRRTSETKGEANAN